MRCTTFALLAVSALNALVDCAPFMPGGGNLQKARRDAIDYPLGSELANHARKIQKRDLTYSVVQVDGDAQATAATAQPVVTVTNEAPTQTIVTTAPAVTETPSTTLAVVYKTVVETQAARPSSTVHYYDDGLWHTYYPVKDFGIPSATATAQLPDPTQVLTADDAAPVVNQPRSEDAETALKRRTAPNVETIQGGLTYTEEEGLRRFMA